ncbi:Uma2 family endonuclease [Micromonospora sp. NPDC048839]|uniref:Uma2 family endonuclease n=1 Tax=Micromonospora sp. NPDC048839 TaxID=3155641 RepID=UPI0033E774C7
MVAAPILPERHEWTVDDLGELPKDLPYELINGRLILPSPTAVHQDLCVRLLLTLRLSCPPEYLVSIDLSMRVDRRNEPRPDVVVIRRRHAGRSPVPVEDTLLAVEVVAPPFSFRDMYDKAKVYAHAGVRSYWVVDPLQERVMLTE